MYAVSVKNNVKKKKSEFEMKLVGLLLIAGNVVAIKEAGIIDISFFKNLLDGIIVACACAIIAKTFVSLIKHLKSA